MTGSEAFNWKDLQDLLPEDRDELAAKHGIRFLNRHNSKLKNIDQLLRMFFYQVAEGVSLDTAAAVAEAMGLPQMTGVALHLRARTLGPYLAELLSRMLDTNRAFEAGRWGGYEVSLIDGTTCVRPGGDRATARILYRLRLADLHMLELHVSDDKQGETFRRLENLGAEQLVIGDRAYANPPSVAFAHNQGAAVLVRHNWASLPLLDHNDRRVDIFSCLNKVKTKPRTWTVWVRHEEQSIRGRLIIERLPQQEAKQARAKLKKENPGASKKTIRSAGFRIIFTTAPPERLSAVEALALYALRWQIELKIKRDKSLHDLDTLPNSRDDTIASWLYAKLILSELTRRICDGADRDLSPSAVEPRIAA